MTSIVADAAVLSSGATGLSILLKATCLLGLGLMAAWLARRKRASVRHVLLAATFATLLALPLLVVAGPAVSIEIPVTAAGDVVAASSPTAGGAAGTAIAVDTDSAPASRESSRPALSTLLLWVWLGGAGVLMISFTLDLWRIRCIARNGLPWIELRGKVASLAAEAGVRQMATVVRHEDVAAPFMCGIWRPMIVLPAAAADWRDDELTRALVHELEHVRRMDWAVQCAVRFTSAWYWCHPLVWVAWRRLCLEAERACDDAVVQRADRADYAEQLVTMARRMSGTGTQPVLGMANRSDLASRVAAILDGTQRRGRAGTLAVTTAVGAAVLIGGAIAPVRAVAVPARATAVAHSPAVAQSRRHEAPAIFGRASRFDVALLEAAADGDLDAIRKLLDAGADVNAAIVGDGSPLIAAARSGRLDAVRLLLNRGADVDKGVPGDGSPLSMASREGHVDVVILLLDRGATVDQVVVGDENALIQASGGGSLEVVKHLVLRGADVNARVWAPRSGARSEWRTPLGVARQGRHASVAAFLQSAGAVE
jgi:beta-lactamase regulating signal transducer with metallopeptidase domain